MAHYLLLRSSIIYIWLITFRMQSRVSKVHLVSIVLEIRILDRCISVHR